MHAMVPLIACLNGMAEVLNLTQPGLMAFSILGEALAIRLQRGNDKRRTCTGGRRP